MPLPESIRVKYTEEEAEYVSMRPVVQQEFRSAELVDMILSVTGKDLSRVQQILHSGTVVFHSYRYWWRGFEADTASLADALANYPDPDPSRAFRPGDCTEVILESSGSPASHAVHFRRDAASKKRLFRSRSLWDCLMALAEDSAPAYRDYSYALRADVFSSPLAKRQLLRLAVDAHRYATRGLRAHLALLPSLTQVLYVCPRRGSGTLAK